MLSLLSAIFPGLRWRSLQHVDEHLLPMIVSFCAKSTWSSHGLGRIKVALTPNAIANLYVPLAVPKGHEVLQYQRISSDLLVLWHPQKSLAETPVPPENFYFHKAQAHKPYGDLHTHQHLSAHASDPGGSCEFMLIYQSTMGLTDLGECSSISHTKSLQSTFLAFQHSSAQDRLAQAVQH